MLRIVDCVTNQHDLRLAALAVGVCLASSVAAFSFDRARRYEPPARQDLWSLFIGCLAGGGAWATHFIAMMAYEPGMPIRFAGFATGASFLAGTAGLAIAFAIFKARPSRGQAITAGAVAGVGIALMHVIGVAATLHSLHIEWDLVMLVAATAICAAFGCGAFLCARAADRRVRLIAPPLLLALSVASLHFTAMSAIAVTPDISAVRLDHQLDRGSLAAVVAVMAGVILAAAFVIGAVQAQARRASGRNLNAVFDTVPAALAKFDAEARLVLWNTPYADFLASCGVTAEVGLTREQVVRATVGDEVYRAVAQQRSHNPNWKGKGGSVEWRMKDGRWVRAEVRGLGDGASLTVLTDITDSKAQTDVMAEERDRERAANQAKSTFLAHMSHEIRTPLNGILGMVQVMERGALETDQRERLEVIKQSGNALLGILNDVLDLSKIEAGKLQISRVEYNLAQLANETVRVFEGAASAKDLKLILDLAPGLEGTWRGDALRIRQILSNLVGNAVKFTQTGSVRVRVACEGDDLILEVADTGIGIPHHQVERLFEKFSQADETTTRRFGGTGLGLAICRDLAGLMGGRIEAESDEGYGSTFRVVLPAERIATAVPMEALGEAVEAELSEAPLRILAAEDNATNQLVLRSLLAPLGVELTMVPDGAQAVDAFKAEAFDLVLMDMQMPVMNGVDAALAIRAYESLRGQRPTPIIALTANVMQHQVDSYREAGMDGALAKPIEVDQLYRTLQQALWAANENSAQAAA